MILHHKYIKLILIVFICLNLTGCWNARELTDLSIVSAFGIDKTDQGLFRVSFQIVNAGSVATGQEGAAGNLSPIIVYSEEGETIFEAIRKATKKVSRKMYFPHTSVVVISETIARENGVESFLDWFERDHEFRTNVNIVVARGTTAEVVLQNQSSLERISANKIVGELQSSETVWGENVESQLGDVLSDMMSDTKEVVISGVSLYGDVEEGGNAERLMKSVIPSNVSVNGIGIFKEGKLIDWLNDRDARGFNWIIDNIQSTIVNLPCEQEEDRKIAIEIIRSNTSIKTKVEGDNPKITIEVSTEGNIGEVSCSIDLLDPENVFRLEEKFDEKIKEEITQTVEIAQQLGTDIFGFGNAINRQHRKEWEKIKDEWKEMFPDVEVTVDVNAFIRRTGMNNNNFLTQ